MITLENIQGERERERERARGRESERDREREREREGGRERKRERPNILKSDCTKYCNRFSSPKYILKHQLYIETNTEERARERAREIPRTRAREIPRTRARERERARESEREQEKEITFPPIPRRHLIVSSASGLCLSRRVFMMIFACKAHITHIFVSSMSLSKSPSHMPSAFNRIENKLPRYLFFVCLFLNWWSMF